MPSIDQIYRSKFLAAVDVPKEGMDYPIKRVRPEPLRGRTGEVVTKLVLYSSGKRADGSTLPPFAVNKTNANAIALVIGSRNYEDWIASIIRIKRVRVEAFGKMVWGVRVDIPPELEEQLEAMESEDESLVEESEDVETEEAETFRG